MAKIKTIFNLEALVSIEIFDKMLFGRIEHVKAKKHRFFSFLDEEEKYYLRDLFIGHYLSEEEITSGVYPNKSKDFILQGIPLLVKDKNVYQRPYVKSTFVSSKVTIKYFNEFEDALDYGTKQANQNIQSQLVINEKQKND
jgi:hypothetical protein